MAPVRLRMVVVFVFAVVRATCGRGRQSAVKIRGDQLVETRLGRSCPHADSALGKEGERAGANATGDDHLDTLLAKPPREQPRLVFGRRHDRDVQRGLGFRVHFDQRKLTAASEVTVQATGLMGDGDSH